MKFLIVTELTSSDRSASLVSGLARDQETNLLHRFMMENISLHPMQKGLSVGELLIAQESDLIVEHGKENSLRKADSNGYYHLRIKQNQLKHPEARIIHLMSSSGQWKKQDLVIYPYQQIFEQLQVEKNRLTPVEMMMHITTKLPYTVVNLTAPETAHAIAQLGIDAALYVVEKGTKELPIRNKHSKVLIERNTLK